MRKRRRELDSASLAQHSDAIAKNFLGWLGHRCPQRVASYRPYAGEASPEGIGQIKRLRRCTFHYPLIQRQSMSFLPDDGHWQKNALGILEPKNRRRAATAAKRFDIVLVPLVAFDDFGNRLGQGGGFYDRCFAFKKQQRLYRKPLLIGIAHQFQQVEQLPCQAWDIPLDLIITEAGVITPSRQS